MVNIACKLFPLAHSNCFANNDLLYAFYVSSYIHDSAIFSAEGALTLAFSFWECYHTYINGWLVVDKFDDFLHRGSIVYRYSLCVFSFYGQIIRHK